MKNATDGSAQNVSVYWRIPKWDRRSKNNTKSESHEELGRQLGPLEGGRLDKGQGETETVNTSANEGILIQFK